jgi:hypothetical protein
MEAKKSWGGSGRGQGRKPGNPEDRMKQRAIHLTDKQWDHCSRHWSLGVGASEYVRRLVEADMKKRSAEEAPHKEDTPTDNSEAP